MLPWETSLLKDNDSQHISRNAETHTHGYRHSGNQQSCTTHQPVLCYPEGLGVSSSMYLNLFDEKSSLFTAMLGKTGDISDGISRGINGLTRY